MQNIITRPVRKNLSYLVSSFCIAAVGYLLWDKNNDLMVKQNLESQIKNLNQKLSLALEHCEPLYFSNSKSIDTVNGNTYQQNVGSQIEDLQQQLKLITLHCESCIKNFGTVSDHLVEKQNLEAQIKGLNQQLEAVSSDYTKRIKSVGTALVEYDKQFDDVIFSAYQTISAIEAKLVNFKKVLDTKDPTNKKITLENLSEYMKKLEILDRPILTTAFNGYQTDQSSYTPINEASSKSDNVHIEEPKEKASQKLTL